MPNWVSWAAHSHLPLPSFRTYSVLSLGLFLGAVFNCSLLTSFSSSISQHSQALLNSHKLVDSAVKSWLNSMFEGYTEDSLQTDDNHEQSRYSYIFDYFDMGHLQDQSPEVLLAELSKKYPGGFPKEWKQVPFYCAFLLQNSLVVWSLINLGYCSLLLVARSVQRMIFGELRVSERQNMRDSFWNYVFYKFIFIFGVLNVTQFGQLILWSIWFSMFSFLRLMNQLSKDRFDYVAYSPNASSRVHRKIIFLLSSIFVCSLLLFSLALKVYSVTADLNLLGFLLAECCQLFLRNLLLMAKYAFHLRDLSFSESWENKSMCTYYTEFYMELTVLGLDLLHHAHMLIWSNVFLSMACLVICMQVRHIIVDIQHRFMRHKEFCLVTRNMDAMFPEVRLQTPRSPRGGIVGGSDNEDGYEDESEDTCAICWDTILVGRKLPCSHVFHRSCLRSWLVQDSTCPTCRHALKFSQDTTTTTESTGSNETNDTQQQSQSAFMLAPNLLSSLSSTFPATPLQQQAAGGSARRNYFHFDGSRIASWLPSFSVEVTHGSTTSPNSATSSEEISNTQREYWTHQIHVLFPHIPIVAIQDSLAMTHSLEVTIDQILEGTIFIPPGARSPSEGFVDEDNFSNVTGESKPAESETVLVQKSSSTTSSEDSKTEGIANDSSLTFDASASRADQDSTLQLQVAPPNTAASTSAGAACNISLTPLNTVSNVQSEASGANQELVVDDSVSRIMPRRPSIPIPDSVRRRKKSSASNSISDHVDGSTGSSLSHSYDRVASTSKTVFGDRFSKNPEERQLILQQRKRQMIADCKRAYLEKHSSDDLKRENEESQKDLN